MRALPVLVLLVATVVAGCIGAPEAGPASATPSGDAAPSTGPHAVVALIDTGINPYHEAFRDDSALAYTHPSEYLPGYPEDAEAVNLTLDADSLENATAQDASTWANLTEGQLYWFPGTKIVGAYATEVYGDDVIFSTGHGTMTASRAAANEHSLCPECRIAMVEGFNSASVTWASEQPWIDAQSNSWSPFVVFQQADAAQEPGLAEAFEEAAARHAVFGSAGNGVMGKLGVAGHPSFTRSTSGPPGVVSVGGHDNGQVELWSGSTPHVVADVCANVAAVGDQVEGYGPEGGGTSSASPYAAGAATRIALEARGILGDVDGRSGPTLAEGTAPADLEGTDSPLADGDLTLAELKDVLFHTAVPRPLAQDNDGEICRTSAPYNTYPVDWQQVPRDAPMYYFIGYGQVSVDSLQAALDVLHAEADLPAREWSDQQHATFDELRQAYNDLPR